ncbi:FAD-binding protein [Alteromonas sp. C1M14]|uniref:electron transfer flavoprotein subunit alpha/FixB family protein n=1 Tax=Alteromonas sp. C1M14 TaxID=2841567 RepID=UPI001C0876D7|nr:FAD-binding protein [Alteromonas sp. C1M14]MBU2980018.1 FAD-binding protein [Alteromonas sp. C1M14]
MTILVIAEHDNNHVSSATFNTLAAAVALKDTINVLVMGDNCKAVATSLSTYQAVDKVLLAEDPVYAHQLAENTSELVVSVAGEYSHVLAPATTFGKNLLPRSAALLDVQPIADVQEILDPRTFKRPIYAGNVIATVTTDAALKFLTIRTTAFDPVSETGSCAPIEPLTTVIDCDNVVFEEQTLAACERPELASANVVVSGGRGLQSADQFAVLYPLADKLGAAVGASRAAVDAGFVANDLQVGQTGKIVAPELYIAVGLSGAIQHLAGMQDSKIIVAINQDEDAPIFQVADYGLVGDLFELVPALTSQL